MKVVDRALGSVRGLRILDIGCGTGRAAAAPGAAWRTVTGWDFAERALEAARAEHSGARRRARAAQRARPPPKRELGRYRRRAQHRLPGPGLPRREIVRPRAFPPGGAHAIRRSRCCCSSRSIDRASCGRILGLSELEWRDRAERAGLEAVSGGRMCFVPTRFLLAFCELPSSLVEPLFRAGESALSVLPAADAARRLHLATVPATSSSALRQRGAMMRAPEPLGQACWSARRCSGWSSIVSTPP